MKIKIGQIVEASITRNGGAILKITGEVKGFETNFGRNDIVVTNGAVEDFAINQKSVVVKKPVE